MARSARGNLLWRWGAPPHGMASTGPRAEIPLFGDGLPSGHWASTGPRGNLILEMGCPHPILLLQRGGARKCPYLEMACPQAIPASTGPRASARGNMRGDDAGRRARMLQRGRARKYWGAPIRKLPPGHSLLQRGRARPRAEMAGELWGLCAAGAASTGPRASARGNRRLIRHLPHRKLASTGPRASARGNDIAAPPRRASSLASMGPRASARGNASQPGSADDGGFALQWGRARPRAEMGRVKRACEWDASFNGAARVRARKLSPGPPCLWPPRRFNGAARVRARKLSPGSALFVATSALQRGRARPRAEMMARLNQLQAAGRSFNGAARVRARKCSVMQAQLPPACTASTGPRASARGNEFV